MGIQWKSSQKAIFTEKPKGSKINVLFPKDITGENYCPPLPENTNYSIPFLIYCYVFPQTVVASYLTSVCLLICEIGMMIVHASYSYREASLR